MEGYAVLRRFLVLYDPTRLISYDADRRRSSPSVLLDSSDDHRGRSHLTVDWRQRPSRPVAQGYRDDNPAGHAISAALPKTGTVRKHQRALPFAEVGATLDKLRASGAFKSTILALEFLVLTACRSREVRLEPG